MHWVSTFHMLINWLPESSSFSLPQILSSQHGNFTGVSERPQEQGVGSSTIFRRGLPLQHATQGKHLPRLNSSLFCNPLNWIQAMLHPWRDWFSKLKRLCAMKWKSKQIRKRTHRPILHHQKGKPEFNNRKTGFRGCVSAGKKSVPIVRMTLHSPCWKEPH